MLNRLQYSVNMTFVCTGKPKNLCDSLYHEICFTLVLWNPTRSISEVCLYWALRSLIPWLLALQCLGAHQATCPGGFEASNNGLCPGSNCHSVSLVSRPVVARIPVKRVDQILALSVLFFCFLIYFILIYLFLAVLALRCCARAFFSCGERGLLFVAEHEL